MIRTERKPSRPGRPELPAAPQPRGWKSTWTSIALVALVGGALLGCDDSTGTTDAAASTTATAQSTATVPPVVETQQPTPPPPVATTPAGVDFAMPAVVGMDLQSAQDLIQTNGVFLSLSHDLLGNRHQVLDSGWTVCTQNIPPGQQVTGNAEGVIDLGVVKREESCP